MRLTPHFLMRAFRAASVLAVVGGVVALTGPFRYSDLNLPFPDTVAHALLFYGLTLAAIGGLPRSRANEVAVFMLGMGLLSEAAQQILGRQMSLHDLAGDAAGVAAAYAPIALTRLRELARTHPHLTFAELRRIDPRHAPRPRSTGLAPKPAGDA
jgi:VanZ family protein